MRGLLSLFAAGWLAMAAFAADDQSKIKVLIVDGQNNHNWKGTTPVLKEILEETGKFTVDVATSPAKDTAGFAPKFSDYQLIVSNYNGAEWPEATKAAFAKFVAEGGGFVPVHAANNSFPKWPEYNAMIGVGGWGGRNEKSGPYIRLREGAFVKDTTKGNGGSHGKQHPFLVEVRNDTHPITKGLPTKFLHVQDELYDRLRGPAEKVTVLATAFADPKTGGSGEHEPMLMTIDYEKGRIFHTTLGHSPEAMQCVGFAVTFARGCEWAATGKVTQKVPDNFPTEGKLSTRK
jgi:uncharacterized protein